MKRKIFRRVWDIYGIESTGIAQRHCVCANTPTSAQHFILLSCASHIFRANTPYFLAHCAKGGKCLCKANNLNHNTPSKFFYLIILLNNTGMAPGCHNWLPGVIDSPISLTPLRHWISGAIDYLVSLNLWCHWLPGVIDFLVSLTPQCHWLPGVIDSLVSSSPWCH